jgi:hypothetical protein
MRVWGEPRGWDRGTPRWCEAKKARSCPKKNRSSFERGRPSGPFSMMKNKGTPKPPEFAANWVFSWSLSFTDWSSKISASFLPIFEVRKRWVRSWKKGKNLGRLSSATTLSKTRGSETSAPSLQYKSYSLFIATNRNSSSDHRTKRMKRTKR